MQISRDWLAQYVDLPDDGELARRLTAGGFAVDGVETVDGDTVFDLDITTNRPDAMCHLGLAREAAILLETPLEAPVPRFDEGEERAADAVEIVIDEPELCSRYAGRVIRGVTIGPSPDWLRKRLTAIGLRPINNVVDVTNFVLWEMGQPLHAFDLHTLGKSDAGKPRIRVRLARAGETLTTLDGEERELTGDMLVIADAAKPVALAGVMGGLDTEVTEESRDILLESAWFDPASVRRTARALGMHTDASHRFERGADPEAQAAATDRAAELIAQIAGGTVLAGVVDTVARTHQPPTIPLDLARLDAFAGVRIPRDRALAWLEALGCALEQGDGEGRYRVTVPSWRQLDLLEEADLFEEVLRLYGFDHIPSTLPRLGEPDGPPTIRQRLRRQVRDLLAAAGWAETISLAFHSPEAERSLPALVTEKPTRQGTHTLETVALANPLSELYSVMRRSLLPGLRDAARFNARRQAATVRLFEIGGVFGGYDEDGPGGKQPAVDEREALALVAGGTLGNPWQGERELDFFDLKGVLEAVASACGAPLEARPLAEDTPPPPGFLAAATADLWTAAGDGKARPVGRIGQLDDPEMPYPLFAAEILLDALERSEEERHAARQVTAPPKLPGIEVDLTLTHPLEVPWAALAAAIEESARPELRRFALKDRYQGKGVPDGAVNTTLTFAYDGGERQLTQDEVNGWHQELAGRLTERFGLTSQA